MIKWLIDKCPASVMGLVVVVAFLLVVASLWGVLALWSINSLSEIGGSDFYIPHTPWNYFVTIVFGFALNSLGK